jgi:hypothetical protein
MDKKKVIELIKEAKHLAILRKYENRQTYLHNCICRLEEALKELSKSDWISVEDEPAPRLEWDGSWNDIVVCYKDKWVLPLSYVVRNDVEFTHWRRIEKLEE